MSPHWLIDWFFIDSWTLFKRGDMSSEDGFPMQAPCAIKLFIFSIFIFCLRNSKPDPFLSPFRGLMREKRLIAKRRLRNILHRMGICLKVPLKFSFQKWSNFQESLRSFILNFAQKFNY